MIRHSWVLGGWMIGKSGNAMYDLHYTLGDEKRRFPGLASKPVVAVLVIWASKSL
jgi:hypothetical protein